MNPIKLVRRNLAFTLFVVPLFAISVFFAVEVENHRAEIARARLRGVLEPGASVRLVQVIDGDEVSVLKADGSPFVVRLLGIKSFNSGARQQGISEYGERAVATLQEQVGKDVELRFPEFKADSSGRVLAYLHAGERDLGAELVEKGLSLTFTRYPFDRMEAYSKLEEAASQAKLGLWGSPRASQRAEAMKLTWEAISSGL
jgi:endonuclease YncB( thermonuclease family)